jgi:hypothetical protein
MYQTFRKNQTIRNYKNKVRLIKEVDYLIKVQYFSNDVKDEYVLFPFFKLKIKVSFEALILTKWPNIGEPARYQQQYAKLKCLKNEESVSLTSFLHGWLPFLVKQ